MPLRLSNKANKLSVLIKIFCKVFMNKMQKQVGPAKSRSRTRSRRRGALILKQAATKATIHVRLDSRTVITLPTMAAFKMWKSKYPEAKVISS